jgi:outer membrane receptor protein involved in Fe transport
MAEIAGSNVYSQDDRSIRTGRFGESRRTQAPLRPRAGDVAIARQPHPDEGDRFIASRCLLQVALPIGGICMRVKDKKPSHGDVHPARKRAGTPTAALAEPLSRHGLLRSAGSTGVAAVVAGILGAAGLAGTGTAHAQATVAAPTLPPPPTTAQTSQSLQEVVVTATATAVKKIDASYNIVSVDRDLIKQANPLSSADILKLSPGIWPEASGGQTGANIEVAGFPSGGDAPFFTNMLEGMPLYGMPSLSFMDSSSLYRLDDTVERVEIVQGGPAAIFGPGQMGAMANYILRTGNDTPTGQLSATYGTEHEYRTDGFYGFPIGEGWYGSLGGFYRVSNGIRAPQFPSDQGGQFTATLKKSLDGGSVTFWSRVLDDKNQFIVPIPLIQNANGSFSDYPGFNALTGSYGSYAIQNVMVPNPQGGFQGANLANGRGGQLYFFGSLYDQTIGEWTLHNDFIADGGGLDTNALFSGPNPRPLGSYLYGCDYAGGLPGFCSGGAPTDTNNLPDFTIGGVKYSANGGAGTTPTSMLPINATYAGTGIPVPLSQSVIQQGWWFIQKSLQNFADEFRVSHDLFKGDTLTVGGYVAIYEDNDKWSLGNQMLMTNTPNATPIVLNYAAAGTIYNLSSSQGFVNDNGNYNIVEHGNARNLAGYLSDSWHLGGWLFQAGARLENIDAHQRTCNSTAQQLSTANDLWDNAVPICNGTWDYEHYDKTRPTFTGGVNYEFTPNMSAYVRLNNGVHYNDFDNNIRGAKGKFAPLEVVHNYEGGFKWQSRYAYVDVSAYHRVFTGLTIQETTAEGTPIPGAIVTYGSTTNGVDFDGYIGPFKGLSLRLVADYMDGHYENADACVSYISLSGAPACANIDGAPLQRQPKFRMDATPSYSVPVPWGDLEAWLSIEYDGQRYEDQSGQQPLGSGTLLSGGILSDIGDHWDIRIQGTNLTNAIFLTEGNARKFGYEVGLGGVILARPYEGREVNFTAEYKW